MINLKVEQLQNAGVLESANSINIQTINNIINKDGLIEGGNEVNLTDDGTSGDNLTLTTANLNTQDLKDTDHSDSSGFNLGVSTAQTTIGGHKQGHEKEGITRTTIGNGTINATNTEGEINRDLDKAQETTLDIETGGLNASVTIDNRVFTEGGRKSIAEDIDKTGKLTGLKADLEVIGNMDSEELNIFINGVFNSREDALESSAQLAKSLGLNQDEITTLYNKSYGPYDLLESLWDMVGIRSGNSREIEKIFQQMKESNQQANIHSHSQGNQQIDKAAQQNENSYFSYGAPFNVDQSKWKDSRGETAIHKSEKDPVSHPSVIFTILPTQYEHSFEGYLERMNPKTNNATENDQ